MILLTYMGPWYLHPIVTGTPIILALFFFSNHPWGKRIAERTPGLRQFIRWLNRKDGQEQK